MKTQAPNSTPSHRTQKAASVSDMTVGSPLRQITKFALPLILGYILQQMYLVIDAVIVGRWIGVEALAAVGASPPSPSSLWASATEPAQASPYP